ncbi:MAG: glycosyltransferase [Acidobacteriota bacterium]|nr:glycosyltransferase [Acidobacteriota bacterium]
MNLLLISFTFPPSGGVGVLRALSLAKYLPEHGVRVDVLSARNAPAVGKDPHLLQQIPDSVTLHSCWTLDLPFAVRKGFKRLLAGKGSVAAPAATGTGPAAAGGGGLLRRIKQAVGNLLLPDPQIGWLPFALPAARRIIRSRAIDAVVITVPPFSSTALVGKLRAEFPDLPIFLDFRDEWLTTTLDLVMFNKNDKARSVARQFEAEAVRAATGVVMVTEAAQREIRNRYPQLDPGRVHCIPNGFDMTPKPPAVPTNNGTTVLTYLGSVYGSTDPTVFVEAVLGLPEAVRSRLRVRFIGRIETAAYREALQQLGETVELRGFMPQAEALRAMEDTTYVLLITRDPINVSAKFYDYLGGGKPILAAVHPQGDVRQLLEQTRAGWWADGSDVDAVRALLTQAVERQPRLQQEFQPDPSRIAQYHRRPLAQRYAALLRQSREGTTS